MHLLFIKSGLQAVIQDHDGLMLQAGGTLLPHLSVPCAQLLATWTGVRVVIEELHAIHLWLEGDSVTVVSCLKDPSLQLLSHLPFVRDFRL